MARVVVIGASSGLGRAIGLGLAARGDQVALMARRVDRITEAAAQAGNGAVAVACDVTSQESCNTAIARAVEHLGGIDALVYTPGVGTVRKLVDIDADTWRQAFETNVIGAALATAAALPHLDAANGTALYLSSISASMTQPWPGLGSYAVTKAALDKLVDAWRAEHPHLGFTRVVVGDCAGGDGHSATEFASGWDWGVAAEVYPIWQARNYLTGALMDVEDLIIAVHGVIHAGRSMYVPSITVTPRAPRPT